MRHIDAEQIVDGLPIIGNRPFNEMATVRAQALGASDRPGGDPHPIMALYIEHPDCDVVLHLDVLSARAIASIAARVGGITTTTEAPR